MEPTREPRWHALPAAAAIEALAGDPARGLPGAEVARRRAVHGPNVLADSGGRSLWSLAGRQLRGPMIALLLGAAAVSVVLGELSDAIAIAIIVLLNATLGVVQEYRAERAVAALKRLEVPIVTVWRDGTRTRLPAVELVPGDVFEAEAGGRVPADARLIEAVDLTVDESALTGEAAAVTKDAAADVDAEAPVGDRLTMLFLGTAIDAGRGRAVVTAIGMSTELGRIAGMLATVERQPSPLERRLGDLGRRLALIGLGIVAVVVALGWLRGEPMSLLLLTGLSLAVAAVPEGLPAVATVTLALGARRMLAKRTLVRRLPAVETLGSVTKICADKTGTLTRNRMTVAALATADARVDDALRDEALRDAVTNPAAAALIAGLTLSNDAAPAGESGEEVGEATERALVESGARCGLDKRGLEARLPRSGEVPFSAERKRMTTVHALPEVLGNDPADAWLRWCADSGCGAVAVTKGAIDVLLDRADRVFTGSEVRPLDDEERRRISADHDRLAARGMRILGLAFKPLPSRGASLSAEMADALESDLVLVGVVGLVDPPRQGVEAAIERARSAGIEVIMITGDHSLTAMAVARTLGIAGRGRCLTGQALESMSDDALLESVDGVEVFARVAPEHKLRIVKALKAAGHIVAMTGDGVNDAPALRQADIGVAMGKSGTDVAKEAAEMVLLDDHFATIVDAVEEGRTIHGNVRKFVRYILASNVGEVWVMLVAPLLGMPLPLLPLQILWINLITDGPPGLALSLEAGEPGTMERPPLPPREGIFTRGLGRDILWIGLLIANLALATGYFAWRSAAETGLDWRTILFTVLTLSQVLTALSLRAERASLFARRGNAALPLAVGLTFGLQCATLVWPPLSRMLGTTALSAGTFAICLAISVVPMAVIEMVKRWRSASSR